MTQSFRHTENLSLRLTPRAKQVIRAAAAASGQSMSEFVLKSALAKAEEDRLDQRYFVLDPEQWSAFQAALDAPPRVLPGLKRLLERKAIWE